MRESNLPNDRFPFIAAWCVAYPKWNTLGENYNRYDAVSVLKALRPVALLPASDFDRNDPFTQYLFRSMENNGLVVRESSQPSYLIVGSPSAVQDVEEVFRKYQHEGRFSEAYHRDLGRALRYSEKAIEHFLSALARGQSPHELSIIELALPVEDEPYLCVHLPSGQVVAVC